MSKLEMIPKLHTIKVHPAEKDVGLYYTIEIDAVEAPFRWHTLQGAIADLRARQHWAAQVVDGECVYVLTWGPLLAPWEGEPG